VHHRPLLEQPELRQVRALLDLVQEQLDLVLGLRLA
jgi:hypothetical protein